MNGPFWIKQWISNLALLNEQFRNEDGSVDFEALGREEYAFRTAIITRKFNKSQRAKEVFEEAFETYVKTTERARKGGIAKARKTNGDADTREGSDASTTVSTNIGNDQETEARQRKAGSNSRHTPPEVSRESGNNFESAIAEALQKARTGGNSVRRVGVASPAVCRKSAGAPVRMPSWPEFLQYVNANNIDYTDAREWFEMSIVDRDGKDREGNAIKNWKAALKAFCRSKEASRRKTA